LGRAGAGGCVDPTDARAYFAVSSVLFLQFAAPAFARSEPFLLLEVGQSPR
jgi:hypothetical protein